MENSEIKINQPEKITKKDVRKAYFLWWLFTDTSNSYERLQAIGFCASMIPILKKLYKTKEDLSDALKRHLNFFNTEGIWGSPIHGITIAMEEQKANGADMPGEAITSIKTGLMGPMAGIGDTLDWGTIVPIITGIFLPLGAAGNPLGAIGVLIFIPISIVLGLFLHRKGYTVGREAVTQMLQGGQMQQLITGASVLGLFMMGAITAGFVNLEIALEVKQKVGDPISIQGILDSIAPGILPLALVFGIIMYFNRKEQNTLKVLIIIIAMCLLGSFVGLF